MPLTSKIFPIATLLATTGLVSATGPATASATATRHAAPVRPAVTTHHELATKLAKALRHHSASRLDYSIVDPAYGGFGAHESTMSAPASNEKVFTAATLLQQVGPSFRYATPVAGTAELTGHTLHGDLVVSGSGDPTLSRASLLDMAKRLHQAGLRRVTGHLVVDDTRYSQKTVVAGWKSKFVPEETGTVDAFTVDHNVWRGGSSYFHHPTLANARLFRSRLAHRHIHVARSIEIRHAPETVAPLVIHRSPPLASIVHATLTDSINFDAEMMFREAGAQLTGHGSPASGAAAVRSVARKLGLPVGVVHDGSGLSYADRSSPMILQRWLTRIRITPFSASFLDALPVSCVSGTLRYRMCGPNLKGQVRAKTGTLTHVSTLSGYVTSTAGNPVTFSFLAGGVSNYGRLYAKIGAALALFRKHG